MPASHGNRLSLVWLRFSQQILFLPMAIKAQQQISWVVRLLVLCTGAIFLAVETEQMLKARQLFHATTFAVLFLLASLELSITRFLQRSGSPKLAGKTFKSGVLMFYAAMFDLFDVGLDEFIENFNGFLVDTGLLYPIHFLSWLITLAAVVLAVGSLDLFLRSLVQHPLLAGGGLPATSKRPKWPVGSRDPARRRLS